MSTPRLLLCAPASGGGKTTVTCALLQAMMDRKINPVAFKCGPDYIDPMFHSKVIGAKSRNLDLFFLGEDRTVPAGAEPHRVRPGPHRGGHGLLGRHRHEP